MTPKTSLFICTTPRSGSSFLSEAIELTKIMGNPGEWLHPVSLREMRRSLGYGPDASLDLVLKGTAERFTDPNGVFALKVMWTQLNDVLTELRSDDPGLGELSDLDLISRYFPNPHFIFLTRRDMIAQAVSFCRASFSDRWFDYGQKLDSSDGSEAEFNFFLFHDCLTSLQEDNRNWQNFLSSGERPVLELEYEQISQDYRGAVKSIGTLLGIDEGLFIDPTLNRFKKMRDATSTQWTRQCEEILARIEKEESEGLIVPSPPDAFRAEIVLLGHPETVRPSEMFQIRLRITNTSNHVWHAVGRRDGTYWNRVTSTWFEGSDRVTVFYRFSAPLPHELAQGKSVPINLPIFAPDRPGTYQVEVFFTQTLVGVARDPAVLSIEVAPDRKTIEALDFFETEDVDSEGWVWTDWMGSVWTGKFPWIYSTRFGWLFCADRSPEKKGYWFFRKDLGWFWTDRESLPFVWSAEKKEWLPGELTGQGREQFLTP